jgi:hypothetical protein
MRRAVARMILIETPMVWCGDFAARLAGTRRARKAGMTATGRYALEPANARTIYFYMV